MRAACVAMLALCLAGCGNTARKAAAGTAIPFAALGDTLLLPFQGLGLASRTLVAAGHEHLAYVNETEMGKTTLPLSRSTAIVYYAPGFALWPFDAATPSHIYPMTQSLLETFEEAPAVTNAPIRRKEPAPKEAFEEW